MKEIGWAAFAIIVCWASWTVLFSLFAGWGAVALRVARRVSGAGFEGLDRWFVRFWVGWALTIAALQVWHLFLPINRWAFAVFVAIGVAGLVASRRELRLVPDVRRKGLFLALLLLVGLFIANRSAGDSKIGDTGLYHMNSILWSMEYPIVPGVANTRARLGFYCSNFLSGALLEAGPWRGRSQHVASGLLLLVVYGQALLGMFQFDPDKRRLWPYLAYKVVWLPGLTYYSLVYASGFSPDLAVIALAFAIGAVMVRLLCLDADEMSTHGATMAGAVVFLASVGVTLKLSALFLCFFVALCAALYQGHQALVAKRSRLGAGLLGVYLLCVVGVVGVGFARSFILSGYPLFPSAAVGGQPSWSVPERIIEGHKRIARFNSRNRYADRDRMDEILGGWAWLKPWIVRRFRMPWDFIYPFFATVAALGYAAVHRLVLRNKGSGRVGWLALAAIPPLVFWFWAAPQVRYGAGAIWIMTGAVVALAVGYGEKFLGLRPFHGLVAISLIASLAVVSVRAARHGIHDVVLTPGADHGFTPFPEPVVSDRLTLPSGLTMPVSKVPYDLTVPNAEFKEAELRLRVPDSLRRGFRMEAPVAPPSAPPLDETSLP